MWDFSCLKRFHWWWWRSNGVRVFFLFGSHCVPSELIQHCVLSHRTASLLLTVSFYNPSVPIICSDYLQQATRPRRELGWHLTCLLHMSTSSKCTAGKWKMVNLRCGGMKELQPLHDAAVLILTRISGVCFKHVLNLSTNKHLFLPPPQKKIK